MTALLTHLLVASITTGIMILILCLLRQVGRRWIGSRLLYAAWLLIAIRLLMPLSLPASVQITNALPQPLQTALTETATIPSQDGVVPAEAPILTTPPETSLLANSATDSSEITLHLPEVLTIAWALGACITAAFMFINNVTYANRLRIRPLPTHEWLAVQATAQALKVKLPPVRTARIESPCLYGVLRPTILLPAGAIDDTTLPFALLHECCHSRTGDTRWALLRNLLCCLFWFNPLIWLAARLSRADAELACDARVVAHLRSSQRLSYAEALVQTAAQRRADVTVLTTGIPFAGDRLKDRIRWILEARPVRRTVAAFTALVLMLVLTASFALAEPIVQKTMPTTYTTQSGGWQP